MTKDEYRRAKALIERPENWTQYALAATASGEFCGVNDSKAFKFCAIGACTKILGGFTVFPEEIQELWDASSQEWHCSPSEVNDSDERDIAHPRVLRLFDRAIALAKD